LDPKNRGEVNTRDALIIGATMMRTNLPADTEAVGKIEEGIWKNSVFPYSLIDLRKVLLNYN
jgi:hypothetical protein